METLYNHSTYICILANKFTRDFYAIKDRSNLGGKVGGKDRTGRFSRQCGRAANYFRFPPEESETGLSVSRLAGLDRRGGTLGNGAVAHRACVTLLRAYNYPRVPFPPSPSPFLHLSVSLYACFVPTLLRFVPFAAADVFLGPLCRRKCGIRSR